MLPSVLAQIGRIFVLALRAGHPVDRRLGELLQRATRDMETLHAAVHGVASDVPRVRWAGGPPRVIVRRLLRVKAMSKLCMKVEACLPGVVVKLSSV